MGRGRRTGRGNRYFRDGGVRKARVKTNRFVPDRCNSRAASTGGNSRNVIGLACSWSPGIRTENVLPAEPDRLSCIPQTGKPSRGTFPLSDHAPMIKYFPTSKRNGCDPLYKRKNNIALPDELFRSFFICFIDPVRLGDAANRAPLQVLQGSI